MGISVCCFLSLLFCYWWDHSYNAFLIHNSLILEILIDIRYHNHCCNKIEMSYIRFPFFHNQTSHVWGKKKRLQWRLQHTILNPQISIFRIYWCNTGGTTRPVKLIPHVTMWRSGTRGETANKALSTGDTHCWTIAFIYISPFLSSQMICVL